MAGKDMSRGMEEIVAPIVSLVNADGTVVRATQSDAGHIDDT